jgi:TatD DNase family protein
MFVDSHCHLSFPDFGGRIDAVLQAMAANGVDSALTICTTLEEFPAVHALALRHAELWATVGVHPDNEGVAEPDVDTLLRLSGLPRVVGIGETGLDYYRLNGRSVDDMAWQRERFRVHIRAARLAGLPLVVHTRAAGSSAVTMLKEEGGGQVSGVLHCFTEPWEVAEAGLDLGLYISFSGILSFRNAADLREVARRVPLDRCLIETDSPYLAPVPFRGKTNQPAYVRHVAEHLALAKGCDLDTVARATRENFHRLFPKTAAAPTEGADDVKTQL